MALISCAECGKEASDKAAACPHCGAPIREGAPGSAPTAAHPESSRLGWVKWVIGIPIAGLLLLMLIGSCSGGGSSGSRAQSAIELCWKEQSKKSNDPATARFIASTCEKMEADARK